MSPSQTETIDFTDKECQWESMMDDHQCEHAPEMILEAGPETEYLCPLHFLMTVLAQALMEQAEDTETTESARADVAWQSSYLLIGTVFAAMQKGEYTHQLEEIAAYIMGVDPPQKQS